MSTPVKGVREAHRLCKLNRPISAMKHLRSVNPEWGLREAKDWVDEYYPRQPQPIVGTQPVLSDTALLDYCIASGARAVQHREDPGTWSVWLPSRADTYGRGNSARAALSDAARNVDMVPRLS